MKWRPPVDEKTGLPCDRCTQKVACCQAHADATPMMKGPKSIFTPEAKERFIKAKGMGASDGKSCSAAGWSHEVYLKWKQEVRKGLAPPALIKFIEVEVPAAERILYEKALEAIERGLGQEDDDKAAHVGLKVIDKMYPKDHPNVSTMRHEGPEGGPAEFRIVFGVEAAPPPKKPEEEASDPS